MFQSLDEHVKNTTAWTRVGQYASVLLLTVALFGALVLGIHFLE